MLLAILAAVMVTGALVFSIVEHTSVPYGFDWTLDTVTTLGSLPAPDDFGGRMILAGLELFGIGTLFYGLATVAEFFVSGQLSGVLASRRTQKMIDSYTEHYIVCGYGRVGRQVARDLRERDAQIVVIDHDPLHRDAAAADGIAYIEGHASDDEVLIQAGIERADGRDRLCRLRCREHLHRAQCPRALGRCEGDRRARPRMTPSAS